MTTTEGGSRANRVARSQQRCAKATGPSSKTHNPAIPAPDLYSGLSEHQVQAALFKAFKVRPGENATIFAIPNGGARDKVTAKLLKDEGVTAGAPDIFVCVRGVVTLVEVKTTDGVLSAAQKELHPKLIDAGCDVRVAYGFLEAISLLEALGALRPPKRRENGEAKVKCGELGSDEKKKAEAKS